MTDEIHPDDNPQPSDLGGKVPAEERFLDSALAALLASAMILFVTFLAALAGSTTT
jgi:hypothetical protein